jgi:hypothetical protein
MTTQPLSIRRPEFQEYRNGAFVISTDPRLLDVDAIHHFLSRWPGWETEGIARATLERALENSLCFGVYEGERIYAKVGFKALGDPATYMEIFQPEMYKASMG